MRNWLTRLFPAKEEAELTLQREAQSLRLELAERERRIAALANELERLRNKEGSRLEEMAQAETERLFSDLATPVTQLLMQAHLLEVEGKPVQAKDVVSVARRMIRSLTDHGLTLEGKTGDPVSFDPNHHEHLSNEITPAAGQAAVIRFAGVAYRGRLLRKAGVEEASKGDAGTFSS